MYCAVKMVAMTTQGISSPRNQAPGSSVKLCSFGNSMMPVL
ncbi:hypothetical protein SALBM217S_03590 [Streptomyces griseoloalbus]